MKIELHVLQNFAPSNLNRDDTGAPKDCELGGYRRARISSQCQKRAVRDLFAIEGLVSPEAQGARTKRLALKIAECLAELHKKDRTTALALAMGALEGVGLGKTKKGEGDDAWKTEYLLFVPQRIVGELAEVLNGHWSELEPLLAAAKPDTKDGEKSEKSKAKKDPAKEKKAAEKAYPKEVKQKVETLLKSASKTIDVSLFGRMIADDPDWNVEAACQVAQAISTNRVQMDFDFFTAVDDFKPKDSAGSDMMGTVQFNSSCFYRYTVLDVSALQANLTGDDALLKQAVSAYVKAFISAIPTGKQNSMAAHNFPSYVLAVVRKGGASVSLTNAFLKPAKARGEEVDLVDDSIAKLESYARRLSEVTGPAERWTWADRDLTTSTELLQRAPTLNQFFTAVTDAAVSTVGAVRE